MTVDLSTAECVATTPWPLPQSLMVGYFVQAAEQEPKGAASDVSWPAELPEVVVDTAEMEDIRWFSKAEVKAALDANEGSVAIPEKGASAELEPEKGRGLQLPGASSLARRLIAAWAEGEMAFGT